MRIEHLTNTFTKFGSEITEQLQTCTSFCIATAFINSDAIDELEKALKKNHKFQTGKLLIGVYGYFNQKADLLRLKTLAQQHAGKFQVQVSKDISFHWKYYHFNRSRKECFYIGSANFTTGGMGSNGELLLKLVNPDYRHRKSFMQLQASFKQQWEKSGLIAKLRIDLYPEIKPKVISVKLAKEFKAFFVAEKQPERKPAQDETVVVSYLMDPIKASTSKKIYNYNPDWLKSKTEFFVCTSKSHFEQCLKTTQYLILTRISRGEFYAYWATRIDSCDSIKTEDGKYFIAYRQEGRLKKIKPIHEEVLATQFAINLRAVKDPFYYKVLRKNQVKSMQELLKG